ncbi:MAG TPA: LicD family protein [Methanocorpusculum sp.]|nr:LicD family protein [Methanocorpusculum sp.]
MRELSLDEVKQVQLNILKSVDKFCRENNIKYFLDFGTLLGAVRHKGYIPWDDDIDISMLRKDYERFLSEFNKDRNDSLYALSHRIDPKYSLDFCKIHDSKTKVVDMDTYLKNQYNMGINIDLFPIDNVGSDKFNAYKLFKKTLFAQKVRYVQSYKMKLRKNIIKMGVLLILKPISLLFPRDYCAKKMDKAARTYENEESLYAACICQVEFEKHQVFEKSIFDEIVGLEFEGMKFPAPKNYDAILTAEYGDYMTPPPMAERKSLHDFKAYLR